MWCPFADRVPVSKFWPGNKRRRTVVLHVSGGSYRGLINWFLGGSPSSAHFGISSQGNIVQFVSVWDSAWANGAYWDGHRWRNARGKIIRPTWQAMQVIKDNPNWTTISIEHAGFPHDAWTPAMAKANTDLLVWLGKQFPDLAPYVPGVTLIGHKDIDNVDKPFCPGPHVNYQAVADRANAALGGYDGTPAPLPSPVITADSPLLAPPRATEKQAVSYITSRVTGEYTRYDIASVIIPAYWRVCRQVGIDPVVAVAQMIHETGNLTSRWSQRPHRNPAGIGVTGTPSVGVSFPTWRDDAIPAHVGRLVAYAVQAGHETPQQAALIALAHRWRPIPPFLYGVAPTLVGLDGRWSETTGYGAKVAAIADAIRTRR